MSGPTRPLPNPERGLVGHFWRAARAGRLEFQRCAACGYLRWPPAPLCPECLAPGGEWTAVDGRGTVWSFGIYEHVYHGAFRAEVPYNVALVELDAGPRLISNVVGVPNEELRIGMRVWAVFEEVGPSLTLVRFRPEPVG